MASAYIPYTPYTPYTPRASYTHTTYTIHTIYMVHTVHTQYHRLGEKQGGSTVFRHLDVSWNSQTQARGTRNRLVCFCCGWCPCIPVVFVCVLLFCTQLYTVVRLFAVTHNHVVQSTHPHSLHSFVCCLLSHTIMSCRNHVTHNHIVQHPHTLPTTHTPITHR